MKKEENPEPKGNLRITKQGKGKDTSICYAIVLDLANYEQIKNILDREDLEQQCQNAAKDLVLNYSVEIHGDNSLLIMERTANDVIDDTMINKLAEDEEEFVTYLRHLARSEEITSALKEERNQNVKFIHKVFAKMNENTCFLIVEQGIPFKTQVGSISLEQVGSISPGLIIDMFELYLEKYEQNDKSAESPTS